MLTIAEVFVKCDSRDLDIFYSQSQLMKHIMHAVHSKNATKNSFSSLTRFNFRPGVDTTLAAFFISMKVMSG